MNSLLEKIKSAQIRSDKVIWILVMLFAMISVVAVFSTSTYRANAHGVDKTVYFFEQMRYVFMGFGTLLLCYIIPMRRYRQFAFAIYGLSLLMLLGALVLGSTVNGANRSLVIGGHSIQVLEFAKIGLIIYLAKALETWEESLDNFKVFVVRIMLPIAVTCLLVLPNSASTVVLFGILSLLILFIMGVKIRYLLFMVGCAVMAVLLVVCIYNVFYAGRTEEPQGKIGKIFNRVGTAQSRIVNFTDEFKGKGKVAMEEMTRAEREKMIDSKRQSDNAKIAISEGGLIGKGPGKSTQRYYLSEAFSDFIFASIVEEYGLLGGVFVLLLYGIFLFRCIRLCLKCNTPFSQTIVIGLSWLIAIQAMLHIFVNVRLLPITGHTLPLISHGGNAFLVLSGAFGIILSVSRQVSIQAEQSELYNLTEGEAEENE